jgi:hypothetical protein
MHSSAQGASSSVTYEPSYMPFITNANVKGRFTFKDGIRQEDPNVSGTSIRRSRTDLIHFPFSSQPSDALDNIPLEEESHADGSSSKPMAISLSTRQPAKSKKPATSASSQPVNPLPTQPATFMRPAGVDTAPSANVGKKKREVIDKSSKSHKSAKRDSSSSPATSTSQQRKKKTKSHITMDIDS